MVNWGIIKQHWESLHVKYLVIFPASMQTSRNKKKHFISFRSRIYDLLQKTQCSSPVINLLFTQWCCCFHSSLVLCNEDWLPSEHDVFGLYYQNVCGIPHLKTPLFIIMNEQVSMCVTIYFNSFFAYDMRIKQSRDRKKRKREVNVINGLIGYIFPCYFYQ